MKNVVLNILSVRLANGVNRPGLTISYEVIGVNGIGTIDQRNFTFEPTVNELNNFVLPRIIYNKTIEHATTQNFDVK
jgi:hypothetical protein